MHGHPSKFIHHIIFDSSASVKIYPHQNFALYDNLQNCSHNLCLGSIKMSIIVKNFGKYNKA